MKELDDFKRLLDSLDVRKPADENVVILEELAELWDQLAGNNIKTIEHLTGNNVLKILANVLDEKHSLWRVDFPNWAHILTWCAYTESESFFEYAQIAELENVLRKYMLNGCSDELLLRCYRWFAMFKCVTHLVMRNEEIYNIVKSELQEEQIHFLGTLAIQDQYKIQMLNDKQLISDLLKVTERKEVLGFFFNLALHPDAKTLLPVNELIEKASQSKHTSAQLQLCAVLCNEHNLQDIELDNEWIQTMSDALHELITVERVYVYDTNFNILGIVAPIANLCTVESIQEMLGNMFVDTLKQLLFVDFPSYRFTVEYKTKFRKDTSKALWNLAFLETNRSLIASDNGLEKLHHTLLLTEDPDIRRNISGILYMCKPNPLSEVKSEEIPNASVPELPQTSSQHSLESVEEPTQPTQETIQPTQESTKVPTKEPARRGHVMISYNWGNQLIVKRIAKALQDNGYNVWLDIEQMNGSTLEAMASAIEGAELVLMCMSQKYKDSPNCRLEGGYCINRKVEFVPLMMQQDYRPDGWLGIALGAKLYYEFLDEENWDSKIAELIKAIGNCGKVNAPVDSSRVPAVVPAIEATVVFAWNDEDLLAWMIESHIAKHYELFKKHDLNRLALLELQKIHGASQGNPRFFYDVFKELGIAEFGQILLISAAIRNLK